MDVISTLLAFLGEDTLQGLQWNSMTFAGHSDQRGATLMGEPASRENLGKVSMHLICRIHWEIVWKPLWAHISSFVFAHPSSLFARFLKLAWLSSLRIFLFSTVFFFFFCIPLSRGQKAFVLLSPTTRRWNVSESVLARGGGGGHCCKVGNWDFVQGGWSEISDLFSPL